MGQKPGGDAAATLTRVAEAEIGRDLRQQVQALLQASFPGYPSRSYFKLPPHFRYLAMTGDALAGQMGVELRVIRVGRHVVRTFGISDLCVRTSERSPWAALVEADRGGSRSSVKTRAIRLCRGCPT